VSQAAGSLDACQATHAGHVDILRELIDGTADDHQRAETTS
jgi:hypothetical protein